MFFLEKYAFARKTSGFYTKAVCFSKKNLKYFSGPKFFEPNFGNFLIESSGITC